MEMKKGESNQPFVEAEPLGAAQGPAEVWPPRGDGPAPRGDGPAPRGDGPAPRGDGSAPTWCGAPIKAEDRAHRGPRAEGPCRCTATPPGSSRE